MTKLFLLFILLFEQLHSYSQCIGKEKITYGGNWHSGYVDVCPTYDFAFNGDTSKNWNVLGDPIDIMQVEKEVLPVKHFVEQQIINYSGELFFSKVKFNSVEIAYPQNK